ncbi:MAG: DnaJ domain-containing protein [Alphaproteobacteria bacterium]
MRYETKVTDAIFFGLDRPVKTRACDCPGCPGQGEYRAPKNRELTDYYQFCLDHVREYNLNWDYYAGMNEAEIEAAIKDAVCWERETKPLGSWRRREETLKEHVAREFFGEDGDAAPPPFKARTRHMPASVVTALEVLELVPPADFACVKAQYKVMVKKHHPDANGGSLSAEAKLKEINLAFTTLRKIHAAGDWT